MILITGATGRVGQNLIKSLLLNPKYKKKIRILARDDRQAMALFGKSVEIFEANLSSKNDFIPIAQAMDGADKIIHLAALVDYSASEKEIFDANFESTRQLILAAKLQKTPPKIIYLSSTSIYRGVSCKIINENTPPHPDNAYGKSKLASENAIISSGLPYIILRPPIVYGKGFETGFGKIISMIKKRRMFVIGSGENLIPFIHISDLIDAISIAIESDIENDSFILTSGEKLTQKQLYLLISKNLGVSPPFLHIPKSIAYHGVGFAHLLYLLFGKKPRIFKEYVHTLAQSRQYDISRARRLLGYAPKVRFQTGIKELL
ncbi:NAD-dependent epimerase/dehydratase family protein [Candidatus Micrarchaeota archaeon]|nr:NAD-dependent epimerase/dehydratase family protein [Candidatus Micrarchaeota archaeon]